MKCTLRKVAEGIVATIDKRPKDTDHWVYIGFNEPISLGKPPYLPNWFKNAWDYNNYHLVIASTFGVGKELVIQNLNFEIENLKFHSGLILMMQHEYTETETQVIINL